MAIVWKEAAVGSNAEVGLTTKGSDIPYHGTGDGTVADAKAALFATAAPTLDTLILDYVHAEEIGGGNWQGFARYKSADVLGGVGAVVYSFNTSGGTRHFTQSKGSTPYSSDLTDVGHAPDTKGAIGEVTDGAPAGVDVVFPQFEFQLTIYKPNIAALINAYIATLYSTTAKTNRDVFQGFQPGEVLFLGAQGAKRSGGDWEISLKFAASPNRTSVKIGADATGGGAQFVISSVKGWEHIDVHYAWRTSNNKLVKQPVYGYVHKVYDEIDFAPLLL